MRAIDRLIQTDTFKLAWEKSNKRERRQCEENIKNLYLEELRRWIKYRFHQDLGSWSVFELRKEASKLHVEQYARLTKTELLSEIMRLRKI